MKKLYISSNYGSKFIKYNLPKLASKLLIEKLSTKSLDNIFVYIKNNYNISKKVIFRNIVDSIRVSKYYNSNSFVLYIDSNVMIKNIKLESLLDLITYGNSSIKGSNVILDTLEYIKNNLPTFYQYYIMKKRSNLWQ